MKKKWMAAVLAGVMFLAVGMTASAEPVSGSVGGISFTAYSSIYAGGADAGTVSSGTQISMSVSADYSYVNTKSLKTGTSHQSMDRVTGAVVTFSAPEDCRSVRITASHSASMGSERWSGNTSATY